MNPRAAVPEALICAGAAALQDHLRATARKRPDGCTVDHDHALCAQVPTDPALLHVLAETVLTAAARGGWAPNPGTTPENP